MSESFRDITIASLLALLGTLFFFLALSVTSAQVMQSANYRIQSDSINFGGGLSTSTSYLLESTIGEVGTGYSSSTNYVVGAGYQQMVTNYIAMTAPSNVTMSPSIVGLTGGVSNGSTTVTVTTDSLAGYSLSITAGESPAMTSGGNSIADYVPGGVPDFTFTYLADQAYFGYSPSGADTADRFLDDGGSCGTGSGETDLACWDGLDMGGEVISQSSGANHPLGATTTIHFRVGIGGGVNQAPGIYVATTTLTALSL